MNKKMLMVGLVLVAGVALGLGFYWPFTPTGGLRFSGIVEIQEVRLGSKVGGRVAKVLVKEGDQVESGQPLLIFDVPEMENQKEQYVARAAMAEAEYTRALHGPRPEEKRAGKAAAEAAQAKLDRLLEGWREEEKRQVASELESAEAEYKQALEEHERVLQLYRQKSVARTEYDSALSSRDRARGRVNAARARNDMFKAGNRKEDIAEARAEFEKAQARYDELYHGTREEDIALAKAKFDEAKAKIRELDINLKEAVVKVPPDFGKALVEVISVRPGDLVAPNQPVIRVLRTEDLWVKIFVPETKLGQVTEDKNVEVEVRVDAFPRKKFRGVIKQIANASEFTPRNVQSADERRHQVFAVKIFIPDPQGVFQAGMAAEVFLPLTE